MIDCDAVNASSYASLFGIPVAAWGLLFYIFIAIYSIQGLGSKTARDRALSFIWFVSVAGLLWTVRMALVSVFVLKAVCLTCIVDYIANIFLVISLYFSIKIAFAERFKLVFTKKIFTHAVTAAAFFGIGYLFVMASAKGAAPDVSSKDVNDVVTAHFRQSLYDIKPEDIAGAPVWGNPNAKITIVEFSDFECPFCRIAAFNVRPYLHEFGDNIKVVFMNYPLDNSCNKYVQGPMHKQACLAAEAAICAQKKGVFWEYHDDLFRNQRKLPRDFLVSLGQKYGIDPAWMNECLDSPETRAMLESEIETGHHVYIDGTPSIIINQRILRQWRVPEVLRKVIREELKKK
jgi:protein-disulfide isomerase